MSNKYSRVAKMGTAHSKYGAQDAEVGKGDSVVIVDINGNVTGSGVVTRANDREVIVKDASGWRTAYAPKFVKLADSVEA